MTAPAAPRPVLAIIADLMFRARIDDAARRAGVALRVAKSAEQLDRHLGGGLVPSLVLVDLEAATIDAAAAIARIKGDAALAAVPLVGFSGHTNLEAIRAGRAAGADTVLARSAFAERLPDLLAGAARG